MTTAPRPRASSDAAGTAGPLPHVAGMAPNSAEPQTRGEEPYPFKERELLEGLRRGDPESYERLVREQGGRLLRVARRILQDEDEAQDAVQDALTQVFRSVQSFREGSCLSTWLHRIVVNAALMRLRRPARSREVALDDLLPAFQEDGHHALPPHEWGQSAETLLQREEVREMVRACIARLPESYRVVLTLRDIEELEPAEVAEMLGITRNAVKIRLHRARQALMTLLKGALPEVESRDDPARS